MAKFLHQSWGRFQPDDQGHELGNVAIEIKHGWLESPL